MLSRMLDRRNILLMISCRMFRCRPHLIEADLPLRQRPFDQQRAADRLLLQRKQALSFFIATVPNDIIVALEAHDVDLVRRLRGSGNQGTRSRSQSQKQLSAVLQEQGKDGAFEAIKISLMPLAD